MMTIDEQSAGVVALITLVIVITLQICLLIIDGKHNSNGKG
jgi:hypothetical protein